MSYKIRPSEKTISKDAGVYSGHWHQFFITNPDNKKCRALLKIENYLRQRAFRDMV